MLAFDQILRLVEAGHDVRISPDQSVEIRSGARKTAPLTPAQKQRAYRERQRVTVQDVEVTPEPEAVTFVTDVTNVVTDSVTPPSPPPSPPTPSPSAPSPAEPKRAPARRRAEPQDDSDFTAACAVQLELMASEPLKAAWKLWQEYRQGRHKATGGEKVPWTRTAAELSAQRFVTAAAQVGETRVIDRIKTAIIQSWKGDNLVQLEKDDTHRPSASPPPASSPPRMTFRQMDEADSKEAFRREKERIASLKPVAIPVVPASERVQPADFEAMRQRIAKDPSTPQTP